MVWAALLIAQSLGGGLPDLISNLTAVLQSPLDIRWTEHSLMSILACSGLYIMGICLYQSTQGRTRDGEEHGSAQWASPRQVNAMFCQKQNKILTQHVKLGLDAHKHRRSLNVLVIGGSGAAKTRSYVLPNILEANTNYVITDPKMEVLTATGGYLKQKGFDLRVLNLVNLEQSDGYNPFRYLRDEKDALRLVNNLIQATTPKGSHESDPFWTKAETALLQAIIDAIQTAIQDKHPISFQYYEYTPGKEKILKHGGFRYVFSPYALIWNRDNYYVVGWSEKHGKQAQFRVDRITAIKHLATEYIENAEFDPAKYVKEVFGMYNDTVCRITMLCHNNTMRNVIDHFGENVATVPVDSEHFQATVNVAPSPPFFAWIFTFGGDIQIEKPVSVLEQMRKMAGWLYE